MTYDDVIVFTGGFGRYQRRICFCICLIAFPSAFHSMAGVFIGAMPYFRCLLPFENSENATYQLPENLMDVAYPLDEDIQTWAQCERYNLNFTDLDGNFSTTTDSIKCDSFVYDKTTYELSTVTEFNLVCDDAWLKALGDSLYMFGVLLGALIFGGLSDKYGRKLTLCSTVIFNIVGGLFVAAAPETISYIIFRVLLGASVNALYLISYVIVVEMVIPKRRLVVGVGIQLFFTFGYILLTAFAYFIRNWRIFQVAITIPSLAFLSYWWYIPESVRWLLTKGRYQEAEALIMKAASENGVEVSKDKLDAMLSNNSDSTEPDSEKPSMLALFKYPNLRRKSLLLFFNWFVNNTTYYGLSWNTSNLGGDDYVNFAIAGLVELPAHVLVFFTLNKWGRKIILCDCMVLAGISLLLIIFVPTHMRWLVILLAMIGKCAITASYEIVYVFSAEQYPTVIRNVGVGACSTFARIGGIVAPYIIYLSNFWTPLPYVVLGAGSLTAGLSALLLPETLNEKLPESIEDGEAFGKKKCSGEEVPCRTRY